MCLSPETVAIVMLKPWFASTRADLPKMKTNNRCVIIKTVDECKFSRCCAIRLFRPKPSRIDITWLEPTNLFSSRSEADASKRYPKIVTFLGIRNEIRAKMGISLHRKKGLKIYDKLWIEVMINSLKQICFTPSKATSGCSVIFKSKLWKYAINIISGAFENKIRVSPG